MLQGGCNYSAEMRSEHPCGLARLYNYSIAPKCVVFRGRYAVTGFGEYESQKTALYYTLDKTERL